MLQIPNGYQPVPNADASKLASGNGEVWITDRAAGGSPVRVTDGYPCGWNGTKLAISRNVSNTERQLVWFDTDTGIISNSGIPFATQPGYFPTIAVRGGSIVSSIPGQHFVDGQPVSTESGAGRIEDFDGEHILYPVVGSDGGYTFVVKRLSDGAFIHRIGQYLSNARIDRLSDGPWLSANLEGGMVVLAPDGRRYMGPVGEGRGFVEQHNGAVYCWTVRNEGLTPVLLRRSLGDWHASRPAVIVRGIGFNGLEYVSTPSGLFVAGYLAGEGLGLLTADVIPYDAPTAVYVPPAAPPEPTPTPVQRPQFPPVPDSFPSTWIGCETDVTRGHPKGIGNCAWGAQPNDDRPVTEMSPWAETIEGRTLLCGLWLSDNGAKAETVDPEIAFAKAKGAHAVYLHKDDWSETQTRETAAARQRVIDAGLRPFHGQHVKEGDQVFEATELSISCNTRTFGKDLAKFRDGLVNVVNALAAHQGPPAVCFLTGWFAGGPLEERYPEAADYLKSAVAKMPTPTLRPGEVPPVATPPTPAQPTTPTTPPVQPGKRNRLEELRQRAKEAAERKASQPRKSFLAKLLDLFRKRTP